MACKFQLFVLRMSRKGQQWWWWWSWLLIMFMPIIMKMIGNTLSCSKVLNLSLDITQLINWFFIKDVPGCCSRSARPDLDEEPLEKQHCRRLRCPPCSCPPPPHCAALPESWNWTYIQVVLRQKPRKTQDDKRYSSATKQLLFPEGWYFSFSISKVFPSMFFIISSDHLRKTKCWCWAQVYFSMLLMPKNFLMLKKL